MNKNTWISFLLLYLSWLLCLALLQFWMQSQAAFLDVLGGNLMMLLFAGLFLAGCIYFLRYFKNSHRLMILGLIALWLASYLLIEGLSMLFFVTLDKEMIQAIGLSAYETKDVLQLLWQSLPGQLFDLMTLKNAAHFLDVIYAALIELGFLSPLMLFLLKKDCHGDDKCV